MKKVLSFSVFLMLGLIISQILPGMLGDGYGTVKTASNTLLYICLAFIMINVGREFELDKTRWRSYTSDYFIAMATAAVPWLLIAFYYIFCLDSGLSWQNSTSSAVQLLTSSSVNSLDRQSKYVSAVFCVTSSSVN